VKEKQETNTKSILVILLEDIEKIIINDNKKYEQYKI
jgi:hypothetical protein